MEFLESLKLRSRTVLPDEIDEDPVPPPHGWPEYADALNRIAELETQHAAQVETIGRLQARERELEADVDMSATHAISVLEASLATAQEGERRKREECERLEAQLFDQGCIIQDLRARVSSATHEIGNQRLESERLRREMGKRK
jgi:chromosome segregation ATPase